MSLHSGKDHLFSDQCDLVQVNQEEIEWIHFGVYLFDATVVVGHLLDKMIMIEDMLKWRSSPAL
jgi:hypothetical protein